MLNKMRSFFHERGEIFKSLNNKPYSQEWQWRVLTLRTYIQSLNLSLNMTFLDFLYDYIYI